MGAFGGTRVMEIVKRNDWAGLLWKRIKLTSTRKANAKKRLLRVWQNHLQLRIHGLSKEKGETIFRVITRWNEAVLRACSEPPPPSASKTHAKIVEKNINLRGEPNE